jgi:UDP-GlcNAc:undecaprenyl-phosphate GlcNAc-1-phosphate transferase
VSLELQALSAFAVATIVSFALTPLAAKLAFRVGAVAHVSDRSLHEKDMPSLGGIAILAGLLVASLIFLPDNTESEAIIAGALVIAFVGTMDDIFDLPPWLKLIGQFCGAAIPVFSGVVVDHFTLPFIDPVTLGTWGDILTMIGIVAVINVVNLTDGADGLAAGVCFIGAATFAIITLSLNRDSAAILAAATAGASLGFLFHNFYPATIFMGDAGSNLLGYLLACIAIQGVLKTAAAVALFFPLVILAVPILDTGFVVAKRLKYGKPIYTADRWHFHHRFVNIGFSQRRTVLYLYAWTLCLAGMALALRFIPYTDGHGNLDTNWTIVLALIGVLVLIASFYLVVVLEILKLRRFTGRSLRRKKATTPEEVDAEVAEELATGEFPALDRD